MDETEKQEEPEGESYDPDRRELEDAIRLELQMTSPEWQEECDKVGSKAGEAFIGRFGRYLAPDQIDQLNHTRIVVIESIDLVDRLLHYSDEGAKTRDVLNGVWYVNYRIREDEDVDDYERRGVFDIPEGVQFGRDDITVITPIYAEGEQYLPRPDMLVSKARVDRIYEQAADEDWEDEAIDEYETTQAWAESALHEMIHIVIDGRLPYPINECATRYYVGQTFSYKRWPGNFDQRLNRQAIDYWAQLVKKAGRDLHLLSFGNLEGEKADKLRDWLYQQFTPKKIREIFPDFKWKINKSPKSR